MLCFWCSIIIYSWIIEQLKIFFFEFSLEKLIKNSVKRLLYFCPAIGK